MRKLIICAAFAAIVVLASGCGSVPVSAQGAQNLTGQQGQAAETGSAYVQFSPVTNAFIGFKKITVKNGEIVAEGGADDLAIDGDLALGSFRFGDDSLNPEVSSGGGSQAGVDGGAITRQPEAK